MEAESSDRQTLVDLDDLARAEYGCTLAEALEGQPEDMFVMRLARLSGIPLKKPFADAKDGPAHSRTNAHRYWDLKDGLREEVARYNGPYPLLESMRDKEDPAYQMVREMAKIRYDTANPSMPQIADTILNAQSESNWFTNLVLVVRPHICNPASDWIKEARDKVADLAKEHLQAGLISVIEPLTKKLVVAVPILHFVPHGSAVLLTYFIVRYASHTFCTTEIAPQFQTLLVGNYVYESS